MNDNEYIAKLELILKAHRLRRDLCVQCGSSSAYEGAVYCGACCCARSESHKQLEFLDLDKPNLVADKAETVLDGRE